MSKPKKQVTWSDVLKVRDHDGVNRTEPLQNRSQKHHEGAKRKPGYVVARRLRDIAERSRQATEPRRRRRLSVIDMTSS
jgi:hypothetical protein